MPTYSYKCPTCGNAFDIQQAFTDDSLTVCPTCGGALRKVFSAVGVTFNGSGFYRTDSRAGAQKSSGSSSPAPAATGASPAPASPSPAPSTTSGSKPSSTSTTSAS